MERQFLHTKSKGIMALLSSYKVKQQQLIKFNKYTSLNILQCQTVNCTLFPKDQQAT